MNNITYHKATTADIQTLVDSRVEFLTEYWGKQTEESVIKLRKELKIFFKKTIADATYISWLATYENKFAGVGGMIIQQRPGSFRVPNGKLGFIMNMYTVPSHRKKGIATAILDKLIESGKENNILFFELHSSKEGEPVYVKNGFKLHDEPTYRKFII